MGGNVGDFGATAKLYSILYFEGYSVAYLIFALE